jgi:hypothetical protein
VETYRYLARIACNDGQCRRHLNDPLGVLFVTLLKKHDHRYSITKKKKLNKNKNKKPYLYLYTTYMIMPLQKNCIAITYLSKDQLGQLSGPDFGVGP